MASKTSVGAVIGLEGGREYNREITKVINQTKLLKAEWNELTTSFNKNRTSWKDITDQQSKLKEMLQATADKLVIQSNALKEMQDNGKGAKQSTEDYVAALSKQAEAVNKTQTEYNNLMNTLDNLPSKLEFIAEKINKISSGLKPIGDAATKYLTLPIVGAMTAAVKTAIDWETAFIGVKKTTNEMVDDNGNLIYSYEQLENELSELSKYTASDYATIFKTAELSGQMGIITDQIPEFTKYMIAMGDATNLAAEDAASYIATTLNLMNKGMPIMAEQAKKVGDAIVYLGNNYNTTEADIAHMTARLAPGAALVNLTTADVLALATAMSEAKITAEGGGTAMTQILQNIHRNFAQFSKGAESNLPKIARVAGMSAEDFSKAWQRKPIKALEAFISGLGKLNDEGEYTALVLDELDMAGIRQNLTMSALSLTSNRLSDAIKDSNREFENGNALLDEASQFWDSSEGKMIQFRNAMARLGNSFGKELLPYITEFVEGLTDLIDKFAQLPSDTKRNILKFMGAVALIGPGIKTVTGFADGISSILTSVDNLNKMGGIKGLADDVKGLGDALGTVGEVGGSAAGGKGLLGSLTLSKVAIGGVLAGLGALIVHFATHEEEARKFGYEFNKAIGGVCNDWDTYGLTVSTVLDETGAYATESIAKTTLDITNKTKEGTRKVKEDLINMKEGVRGNLKEMSDIVSYNFGKAKTQMQTSTMAARNQTKIDFDAMSNDIILTTDNVARVVPEKYEGMKNQIDTKNKLILSGFKMVTTGIEREANSLDLTTSGAHMMQTLKNGIENTAHTVISAAARVAKGIAAYLKFSEPEKGALSDFHTAMPDMMQLMAQGINNNAYLVEDAVSSLAADMSGGLRTDNYNYGGVVINLNMPEGTNGTMIVDEIENELATRTLRRKAVFN